MSTSPTFQVLYVGTPNGKQVTVLLEELKLAYKGVGLTYELKNINFGTNEQKEPWFIKLNPNGRIPVLIDHSRNNFAVFETAAILLYLTDNYDLERQFSFNPTKEANDYSEMLQWIFFAHGGIGPMQGQANHFNKFAPEKIPYAIKRYQDETKRLYGVLEIRLGTGRKYLAGPGEGKFSIADIKAHPWVRGHAFAGIETLDEFPSVKAWIERIDAREGVKAGLEPKGD